ncbi:zinc finger MYND domain-containing protein [Sporobolomyces salmoneus]|uniref:zinc finger MYND domain-containing protein n=1 Tax=Sporobolomyces salmoneus TaxID=183962 RepID=UPI003177BD3A
MSSQPSNPGASEECVVCGKKCYTRCSACSSHGLDWMFFCSKEHQKFIWPIHKRFCGVNASPLMWPLLTDAEADEAKEVLKELRREQSGSSRRAEELEGLGYVEIEGRSTRGDLESVLPHILESSELDTRMSTQSRSFFVAGFRRELWNIKHKLAGPQLKSSGQRAEWAANTNARDIIGFVLQNECISDPVLTPSDSQKWFDALRHKVLINFAVLARYYTDISRYDELRPLLQYTRDEIARYCDNVVSTENPELARRLKKSLSTTY